MTSAPPPTLSPALPVGQLLEEYSVISVLGMGSFGITYLAADNTLHLKVAIKEYFPSNAAVRNHFSGSVALKSDQAQAEYLWGKERFVREAQTLARFRHKNIVQVFRYFEGNGTCYMVMAYEEGMSLEQVLAAGTTRWDEQTTLAMLLPLLDGMASVHEAGFLHRDIKPGNIVLRAKDEGPVLIDFGAARSPASTDAMTVILSHGYGPPEQYSRQGNQGSWSDIYAMGGVLYRIVAGHVPPPSLHRVKNDEMIPAEFAGEGRFSPSFLAAIDRALNVDEAKRPQSIGEWRQLLVPGASDGAGVAATGNDIARSTVPHDVPATSALAPRASTTAPSSNHHAEAAQGKIAAAATGVSPNQGRGAATRSPTTRPPQLTEEPVEPGLWGHLGQAMIAHPFLALLLLFASLVVALYASRRPASQLPPALPAAAVSATDARPGIPQAEPVPTAQAPASPTPAAPPPVPVEAQNIPAKEAVPAENPNEGERRRNPLAEAVNACAGKATGANCTFVDRRNESLNGTCVVLPNESLACRPERLIGSGNKPRGSLPYRQNAEPPPMDSRQQRYR